MRENQPELIDPERSAHQKQWRNLYILVGIALVFEILLFAWISFFYK